MNSLSSLANLLPVTLSRKRLRLIPSAMTGVHSGDYEGNGASHYEPGQASLPPAASHAVSYADNDVDERSFDIDVVNGSDRLSSFQVELHVRGQAVNTANRWYEVEPEVCSKCPPGDRTQFHVVINRSPIPAVNTTLDISVHIFSVEYDELETIEHISLNVEPRRQQFKLHLVSRQLKVFPGDRLSIAALALNFHPSPAEVTVKLMGLDAAWFETTGLALKDGSPAIDCTLPGEDSQRIVFPCMPPKNPLTTSQIYPFDLEISDRNDYHTVSGTIEVLPMGLVLFKVNPKRQVIPGPLQTLVKQGLNQTTFTLEFDNQSNLSQQIHVDATETHHRSCRIKKIPAFTLAPATLTQTVPQAVPKNVSQNLPHSVPTALDERLDSTGTRQLEVRRQRPLLGWDRRLFIEVTPTLDYAPSGDVIDQIQLKPSNQVVEVRVRPVIPFWVQLLVAFLALGLIGWLWWLRPQTKHEAPISSVHIISNKRQALSGGRDQRLNHWNISFLPTWLMREQRLGHLDIIADSASKPSSDPDAPTLKGAIRTIEESPNRESQVAIGLENGHIELLKIDPNTRIGTITNGTDRVFALAFSDSGNHLFSGHGSGIVRRWDLRLLPNDPLEPLSEDKRFKATSVRSLAMLKFRDRDFVAIAGQNNSLLLWDGFSANAYRIPYQLQPQADIMIRPVFTQYNALTSVVSSDDNNVLVTADDRGFITLWNTQAIEQCLKFTAKAVSTRQSSPSQGLPSQRDSSSFLTSAQDSGENKITPLDCNDSLQFSQWQATPDGRAIRAIALTEDGQHLASVADTGEIVLWPLDKTEDPTTGDAIAYERRALRNGNEQKGILIDRFSNYAPQSVDIQLKGKHHLIIAVDGPQHRLRLYRHRPIAPNPSSTLDSAIPDS